MVREIENIIIPGYNQYALYSFEYNPGFSDSPGTVEAQFINKTGVYPNTNVFIHSYFPIYVKDADGAQTTLGQFTVVSTEVQESDKYKSLSVRMMDKSVELDRYLIALRGQIGYDSTAYNALPAKEKPRVQGVVGSAGRVIWVGESAEQCKENLLGTSNGTDPCDPCSEKLSDPQLRQLDCEKYYLNNRRIYRYTFQQLLSAISARIGITMGSTAVSANMKFEHVGTVREVLNNICSELGLTFYYNPTTNAIVFVDIKVGIPIRIKNLEAEINKCKILNKTVKHSREGSKDVWGVAGYTRDSEEKRYGCGLNSCKKLRMAPFTLTDILSSPAHFEEESGEAGFKRLEFYSTLNARLGKDFRDLFVWLQEYKFKSAKDLIDYIDKPLKKLNGMKIKKVFYAGAEDVKSRIIYRLLMRSITSKNFDLIKDRAEKKKSYFFLAEVNDTYEQKVNNFENSIANNFLGRFWIRFFKQHWKGLSYQTISPDGNVSYYDFKSPINLPFADMIYEAFGTLSASPLLDRSGFDDIASGDTPDGLVARDTFFLMDRPASFWPTNVEEEEQKNLEKNVRDYLYKEFSAPIDLSAKFKKHFNLPDYDVNTYRLFKVDIAADDLDFDLAIEDNEEHPAEADNVKINVNACDKYTQYGLRDAKTRKFSVKMGDFKTEIFMPVQSYVKSGADHSGYTILVERQGVDASYVIPKAEVFSYGNVPSNSSRLGIDLNFYNATFSDLELLARTGGVQYCDMDMVKIQSLLSGLNAQLSHFSGNTEERSYKIEGFPVDFYTPADGLKSFSVSAGGGGITTSLAFSNAAPYKVSIDSFLKQLQYARLAQVTKGFPTGTYNNTNSTDLTEI